MPEIRYYTVTQEREVKVSATNVIEAAEYANYAFEGKVQEGDQSVSPHVHSQVRTRDLTVREDY